MGPYCQFCGTRCFVPMTENLWELMSEAQRECYRTHRPLDIIATCPEGQAFEKARIGVCYREIGKQEGAGT